MREDMFKVIVERPRTGRSWASKSKLRYDKCEGRQRVSGHRLVSEYSGNVKHLNENLAPLKRYLHKQVGRRWNDVFSEICKHLDTGSTVKMHVREHLDDFILRKVRRAEDGTLVATNRWGSEEKVIDCWVDLYVDPSDGTIKLTRKLCQKFGAIYARDRWKINRQAQRAETRPIKQISTLVWYVQLMGIWYEFQLSQTPTDRCGHTLRGDALHQSLQTKDWCYNERWVVVNKRQLSGKILKKHGLTNAPTGAKETNYA